MDGNDAEDEEQAESVVSFRLLARFGLRHRSGQQEIGINVAHEEGRGEGKGDRHSDPGEDVARDGANDARGHVGGERVTVKTYNVDKGPARVEPTEDDPHDDGEEEQRGVEHRRSKRNLLKVIVPHVVRALALVEVDDVVAKVG